MWVRRSERPSRTRIHGWDGRRAIVVPFLTVVVVGIYAVPLGWGLGGSIARAMLGIAAIALLVPASSGYRITIDARDVILDKTCLGVPYRRFALGRDVDVRTYDTFEDPRPEGVVFERRGEREDARTLVGTSADATALAAAIRDEIARHGAPSTYRDGPA